MEIGLGAAIDSDIWQYARERPGNVILKTCDFARLVRADRAEFRVFGNSVSRSVYSDPGAPVARPVLNDDVNILVEGHQESEEPFYRETLQSEAQESRNLRLVDAEQPRNIRLRETPPLHDIANRCSQLKFGIELSRIR
jgi:hypothetical protein